MPILLNCNGYLPNPGHVIGVGRHKQVKKCPCAKEAQARQRRTPFCNQKMQPLPTLSPALLTHLVVFAPRSIPGQAVTYQSHHELELRLPKFVCLFVCFMFNNAPTLMGGCPSVNNLYVQNVWDIHVKAALQKRALSIRTDPSYSLGSDSHIHRCYLSPPPPDPRTYHWVDIASRIYQS